LINIRSKLSAVKRNRSSYLTMEDIMPIRLETEEEMKLLTSLRGGRLLESNRELNRADDVLDEILQMLSLCFLSLGKKRESRVYNTSILFYKFMQYNRIYQNLIDTIHEVSPELIPIQNKMFSIRRDLAIICCRSSYSPSDIRPLQQKIRVLDSLRVNDLLTYQHQLHYIVKMIYGTNTHDEESREHLSGKFLDSMENHRRDRNAIELYLNCCSGSVLVLLTVIQC
ncbi:hypothetical protein K501DRAFT_284297, partial [Backusella circina FSU 941]